MFLNTLTHLQCPACAGELACTSTEQEIQTGSVCCNHAKCGLSFPILAGVLILVPDVRAYLIEHVKGISRQVEDREIPKEHRAAFVRAKKQISVEHIEEDLESERVTSLYLMNSYLRAAEVVSPSPAIQEWVHKYWDHGPFEKIKIQLKKRDEPSSLVELGCGVGGLLEALKECRLKSYLGLDSSFASIVLARHFAFGAPLKGVLRTPDDLLDGPVSRAFKPVAPKPNPSIAFDFVVCDLSDPPLKTGKWEAVAALNVIDMLPEPSALPQLQYDLLKKGGFAIQSSPYIWHQETALELREGVPPKIKDSAGAVEWLYQQRGFKIDWMEPHVPWLFFKNARQLELYSVHLFFASK
mgnify:CR=1 FL=1